MALTGHLSDLALSELLEFFCNQRKSGRLKVLYPNGAGFFFLQAGSVVDARIGVLQGIDAVFYALTLPNAEFEFSAEADTVNRTINQPWTQVVLEGLRRLDEGITPGVAFPEGYVPQPDEVGANAGDDESSAEAHRSFGPGMFSLGSESKSRKPVFIGAIGVAVLASVAVIGVPAGWYGKKRVPAPVETTTAAPVQPTVTEPTAPQPTPEAASTQAEDAAALAARKQHERDKKARDAKAAAGENAPVASTPAPPADTKPGQKKVVVTVAYDESGRVTQASGGDPTALRIARQKRFPAGKAGSATITIPIN